MTASALLSACAASSLSESDIASGIAPQASAAKEATGSVTVAANDSAVPAGKSGSGKPSGAYTKQAVAVTAVNTPGNVAYKIGPQDILEITVFKVSELSRSAQVSEAGTINFPLVGEVAAAGKTAHELEKDITVQLGSRYLQKPQVAVIVKEFNSQRVTVDGAVKKPGVFPIQGGISLLQAVAMAQGFDATVSDDTVVVVRTSNGKRAAAKFDVSSIRGGNIQDPQLQAGDVVIAGTSSLKEGLNFLKAIPLSGAFALL